MPPSTSPGSDGAFKRRALEKPLDCSPMWSRHTGLGYFHTSGKDATGYTLFHVKSGLRLCNAIVPNEQLASAWLAYVAQLIDWTQSQKEVQAATQGIKDIPVCLQVLDWVSDQREEFGIVCQCCEYRYFREELHESDEGYLLCTECLPHEAEDSHLI